MFHKKLLTTPQLNPKLTNNQVFNQSHSPWYQEIDMDELPQQVKQKIMIDKFWNNKVLKIPKYPHGYVIVFYITFLKVFFTERWNFDRWLQKLYVFLDDDDFKFQIPKYKNSPFYIDWSTSKIKRNISDKFKDIVMGHYDNLDEVLQKDHIFGKMLFLFAMSVLSYFQKISSYEQEVSLEMCRQVLFDYFEIDFEQHDEKTLAFPDAKILVYSEDEDKNLYLINVMNKEQTQYETNTSKTIQINSDVSADSHEFWNVKLELSQNRDFEQDLEQTIRTKNFQDITNRHSHKKPIFISQNLMKNQRYSHTPSPSASTPVEKNDDQYKFEEQVMLSTQGTEWTRIQKRPQTKFKIDKLYEMLSRRTSTQQSFYDDPKEAQPVQYSFLDECIPNNQNTVNKEISQNSSGLQTISQNNSSLMSKWYEFCQTRKNRPKKTINLMNTMLKTQIRSQIQETSGKPDFKKVKQRRRQSQDMNYEGKCPSHCSSKRQDHQKVNSIRKHETDQTSLHNIVTKQQQQSRTTITNKSLKKVKQKQFIFHSPSKNFKNQSVYPKYGYMDMNISNQFTDSVILKQLDQMSKNRIKAIKQKAREQRDSVQNKIRYSLDYDIEY